MALLSQLIRQKKWLFDDAYVSEFDTAHEAGPVPRQQLSDTVTDKNTGIVHLPLRSEQRDFLGMMMQGRWNQDILHCVIEPIDETPIETAIRTVPELWFSEFLGCVVKGSRRDVFCSRDLLAQGFPVGNYEDQLAPVGIVLRKFIDLDIVYKERKCTTGDVEYRVEPLSSIHLEVVSFPGSYNFDA